MWPRITSTRIAYGAGLLALVLGIFQLSLPHVLTGVLGTNIGYDDGAYVGAAVAFAHGAWPYKDFVFVQPPGIIYILSPFALLSHFIGTREVLALARILTVMVTAMNVTMVGLLLRRQGRLGVAVGAIALALWPTTVAIDRTVELEPYLVFACLLGAFLLFDKKRPSNLRLILAGAVFGFAVVIKVWAIFPILVALVCLWSLKRHVVPFVCGLVAGSLIPSLPFIVAAPVAFWRQVLYAQLNRREFLGIAPDSLGSRAIKLVGFKGLSWFTLPDWSAYLVIVVLLAALVYVVIRKGSKLTPLEWFCVITPILNVAITFESPYFYDHYAYFPAAFAALMFGVLVPKIVRDITRAEPRLVSQNVDGTLKTHAGAVLALFIGAGVYLLASNVQYVSNYLSEAWNPSTLIDAKTVPGSCVISDYPSDLLSADRFISAIPNCPIVVDPFGMFLVDDNGRPPRPYGPYGATLVHTWNHYLRTAQYIDMRIPFSDYLPWPEASIDWFSSNYSLIGEAHAYYPNSLVDADSRSLLYARLAPSIPG